MLNKTFHAVMNIRGVNGFALAPCDNVHLTQITRQVFDKYYTVKRKDSP